MSFVVVAFHRPKELETLVSALEDPAVEVVIVAVESDPSVVEVGRRVGAVVVRLDGNPGYGAAVNAGVRAAQTDTVVVSNDDVLVAATVVRALATEVRARGGVVLPALRSASGAIEHSTFALPTPWTLLKEWALLPDAPVPLLRWLNVEKWRSPQGVEQVPAAAATMFACGRETLLAHPIPEAYFLYWEEAEWYWSLHRTGVPIWIAPHLPVTHAGGREDVRPQKSALMARNAVRCVRRIGGRRQAALAWPVVVVWNLRLVFIELVRALAGGSTARVGARLTGLRAAVAAAREVW